MLLRKWSLLSSSKLVLPIACLLFLSYASLILWYQANESRPTERFELLKTNDLVNRRLPQAIIIGCRKSGTRALLKFLELNPDVRAVQREVHFFDRPSNYKLGLNWYRSQMPETSPSELTIEKSPAYFVTKNVPDRISAMNASVKLVVIFRDPVIRLVSDFSQLVANKLEDAKLDREPFCGHQENNTDAIWLEAEKQLEEYVLRKDGGIDETRQAIRVGMYSTHLERWFALFPKHQIYFVDGEKLIHEPWTELHKLELFLGLAPQIEREHFAFDYVKGFYCINKRASSSIKARKSGNKTMWQYKANRGLYCLSKTKGRRHVNLRPQIRNKLQEFYQPYNEYLYSLTGIDYNRNNQS